jgi:hypothetical protein
MPENNKATAHGDMLVRDLSITVGGQPLRLQTPNFEGIDFDEAASGDRTVTFHVTIPARRRITGSMSTSGDLVKWLRPEDAPSRTFELDRDALAEAEEAAAPARAILDKMLEMGRNIRRIKAAAADRHTPPIKFIGGDDEEP